MTDNRRTRWVAHDVYFLDDGLGATMFERFGAAGIALWHGFIAACKKNHVEGETSFTSEVDALLTFGLPGMPLVDLDGEPFALEDWLQLLSDHKVIRRTSRARRVKVACTKWGRWQQSARRSREADRKAEARAAEGEQTPRSEQEKAPPIHPRYEADVSPDTDLDLDTDTDLELHGADAPTNVVVDAFSGGFPTRAKDSTLATAIVAFADTQGLEFHPPAQMADLYTACLDMTAQHLGPQHPSYKRAVVQLCGEYVAAVVGEPLPPGAASHLQRLVNEFGAHGALRGLTAAMTWGAGLDGKHVTDPLALTKYATAVCRGEAKSA